MEFGDGIVVLDRGMRMRVIMVIMARVRVVIMIVVVCWQPIVLEKQCQPAMKLPCTLLDAILRGGLTLANDLTNQ